MKILNNSLFNYKAAITKMFLIISMLLTLNQKLIAQNTSYKANSVPIGGDQNTAFGEGALISITSFQGVQNCATGIYALKDNTTGQTNSAYGRSSLSSNISGNQNAAYGGFSLVSNTTGRANTGIGFRALARNVSGENNTATGYEALYSNLATGLTANGYQALYSNTTGHNNTATGYQSLFSNTEGNYNTANGHQSLFSNTTGSYNSAGGSFSLNSNISGSQNTAFGYSSLFDNITGNYNTAHGLYSLHNNTTGFSNTAVGFQSLRNGSSGNFNTALGDSAGYSSVGDRNIFIGHASGFNETSSNKLYIGNATNKTILYGNLSSGQILLGNPNPTGYTFIGNRTLNVLGGIIADSIRVALSGSWSDYVFADDYQLKPLNELENYIKINKHLPNIPSAEEVAKNGIEVASMDAKLLEKIEELHLYVLQQQKQIDELKRTVKSLNERVKLK